jgi:hypothetical protein
MLPALAILQALHAFPIAGSQTGWSNFLFILIGGLCIADGSLQVRAAAATWQQRSGLWRSAWQTAALAPAVAFAIWFALGPLDEYRAEVKERFDSAVPLGLPGAERLRAPADQAAQVNAVVDTIERRCDSFLTLPGLNSFYIFARQEPPVVLNGPWPFFFTAAEQREIVADVRDDRRLCVVRSPSVLQFWSGFAADEYTGVPNRPLVRFVRNQFEPIRGYSGIFVDVRR